VTPPSPAQVTAAAPHPTAAGTTCRGQPRDRAQIAQFRVILDGLTAGTSDLQSAGLVSAEALDAITTDVNNLESQLFTAGHNRCSPARVQMPAQDSSSVKDQARLNHCSSGSAEKWPPRTPAVCRWPVPALTSSKATEVCSPATAAVPIRLAGPVVLAAMG